MPSILYVHFRSSRQQFRHRPSDRSATHRTTAARRAAAGVLRRQRDLPLPRTLVRGPALRTRRRPRRGLAAHRLRGAGLRRVAAPLAKARRPGPAGAAADREPRRRVRGHERLLLRLADRARRRRARARRPGCDRRGNRRRTVVVRHPVRLRSAGDGAPAPGDVRAVRGAVARDGDRGRRGRPPPAAHGGRPRRDRPGHGRRRTPPPGGLMDQVRLGNSGLHVSRLGLGMMSYGEDPTRPWMLDEATAEPIVRRAVEGGFTFFDTADMYSQGASEVATGRLLRKMKTHEFVVATKVYFPMTPGPNGRGL